MTSTILCFIFTTLLQTTFFSSIILKCWRVLLEVGALLIYVFINLKPSIVLKLLLVTERKEKLCLMITSDATAAKSSRESRCVRTQIFCNSHCNKTEDDILPS